MRSSVAALKEACYACRECPLGRRLVDGLDPHVFAAGCARRGVVFFVGEAPGGTEVVMKRPLVGKAGAFYEKSILGASGISRGGIWTTNAVLCRPNESNRTPLPAEIELCRPHLDAQICLLEPRLLIPMGNVPLYGVCDTFGITAARGRLRWSRIWSNGTRIPVFPIFHPAYCGRGSGLEEMRTDAAMIGELVRKLEGGSELEV